MRRLGLAIITLLSVKSVFAGCGKPVGPELAGREIGYLLRAYPILTQNNPEASEGLGVMLWGCEYKVGGARITVTVTTQPSDPMPCKRKVAFQ